jgi:hypothetical protein
VSKTLLIYTACKCGIIFFVQHRQLRNKHGAIGRFVPEYLHEIFNYSQVSELLRPLLRILTYFGRILHHKKNTRGGGGGRCLTEGFFLSYFSVHYQMQSPYFGCTESETSDAANNLIFIFKGEI